MNVTQQRMAAILTRWAKDKPKLQLTLASFLKLLMKMVML